MRTTHTRLSRAIPACTHPIDKCVFPDYTISARVFRQFYETGMDTQRLFPRSMDGWTRDAISFDSFVIVVSNTGSSVHFVLRTLSFAFDFFMNNSLILLLLILIVNIYKTLINAWFFRYFRVKWSYINDDNVEMKRRRANWQINKAYLTSFRV